MYDATKAAALVAKYTATLTGVTGTGAGYCKLKADCVQPAKLYEDTTDAESPDSGEGFTSTEGCTQTTNPATTTGTTGGSGELTPEQHRAKALAGKKWKATGPVGFDIGSLKGYSP